MGVILHIFYLMLRKVYEKTLIGSKIKGDMRLRSGDGLTISVKSGRDT